MSPTPLQHLITLRRGRNRWVASETVEAFSAMIALATALRVSPLIA